MEVRLGPSDIVTDGDQAPPLRKGAQQPPYFFCFSDVEMLQLLGDFVPQTPYSGFAPAPSFVVT